jgi:hypothetical protein
MSLIQPVPMLDFGTSPKFYVSGLGRVTPMGSVAMFTYYIEKPCSDGPLRTVEVELIAPCESIGPAFDLTIESLGVREFTLGYQQMRLSN